MGKFSQVLFASDFDHTLSDYSDQVPKENIEAIEYFIQEGGRFCVASGRSLPMFRAKTSVVPLNAPCIFYNGAVCYDFSTETFASLRPMPPEAAELRDALMSRFPEMHMEIQTAEGHYCYGPDPLRDEYLQRNGVPFFYTDGPIPGPWLKMGIYGKFRTHTFDHPDALKEEDYALFAQVEEFARAYSAGSCSVSRSMPRIIEIWAAGCDKGSTARALAEALGRPILACAGDAPNDIKLLQAADFSFCPSDCDPIVAAYGFRKTVPCAQGAVGAAIEELEQLL